MIEALPATGLMSGFALPGYLPSLSLSLSLSLSFTGQNMMCTHPPLLPEFFRGALLAVC